MRRRAHEEEHRERHHDVGAGRQERPPGRAGRRWVRRFTPGSRDRVGDDGSLIGPDHPPHVHEHHRAERRAGQDRDPPGIAPARAPQNQNREAGQKRHHRAPAEPPERSRHELLRRDAPGRRVRLGEERTLHEVEVVEETDPRDAGKEVNPAQQELDARIGEERHRVPPVRATPARPATASGRYRAPNRKQAGRRT